MNAAEDNLTPVFRFVSDQGHAWLEVPLSLIDELGISMGISRYSYRRGASAYLEEDCDYHFFADAMKLHNRSFEFREVYEENTVIRWYASFTN